MPFFTYRTTTPNCYMKTVALSLSGFALATTIAADSLSFNNAVHNIQQNLKTEYASSEGDLCTSYTCCNITSAEPCDLKSMPKDESILVLPGGDTRCIFSYSTPYAFQVVPGNSDELVFYFQGGGACWDEVTTTKDPLCTTDCVPNKAVGVFDRGEELNAYKDYTIVHVLYCSGDIHAGSATRPYTDDAGVLVQQRGLANAQAALDWVLKQQQNGGLAKSLTSLVITGCSAGSLGAQLWYDQLVHQLKWDTVAVMPDSYAGVFPDGAIGPLFYDYNFCSSGFLSAELTAKCQDRQLTNMDVVKEYLGQSPAVPVAFLQSKTDSVQMSFYVSLGLTTPNTTAAITPAQFYQDVNDIFGMYNKYPNFMTYLVDGQQHCFTPSSKFFTADAISATDNGESSDKPMMYAWSGAMPLEDGERLATVCEGDVEAPEGAHDGLTYCASSLVPKEFVEDLE